MKNIKMIFILVFIFISTSVFGQDTNADCKVKVTALQGSYKGDCSKGLANGQGEARGTDTYIGKFRKGIPHGDGTYIWANGDTYTGKWKNGKRHGEGDFTSTIDGRDSTLAGRWRNDKWKGSGGLLKSIMPDTKKLSDSYDVTFKRNIERIKFYRYEGEDEIEITVEQGGRRVRFMPSWTDFSSGFESFVGESIVITSPAFPFICKLRYDLASQFGTQVYVIEVHFVIYSAGEWRVIMAH